ncbi:unnamed protein product, partial [marine sediment metagenome]
DHPGVTRGWKAPVGPVHAQKERVGMKGSGGLTRWLRGTCFAGYYWATGRRSLLANVNRLDRLYRAPRAEIDSLLRRELVRLLSHASRTVPYYRDVTGEVELSEETVLSQLQQMPVLTKAAIYEAGSRLVSERPGRGTRWNNSGGSTGEPVRLLQDRHMVNRSRAGELLFLRWAGHRMGEPHVLIWGVPQETFKEPISFHERAYRLIHNETYLNCYKTSDEIVRRQLEYINRKRPTLIEGYVEALCDLSRMITGEGIDVARPRAVLSSAGVLTAQARETIERAFGCPVFNRYGSREVSNMACSCESNTELHVNELSTHLEIMDDDGRPCEPGVEGRVLVTLLTNYTMPLIRYQIEDRAAWASGPCPCGRTTRRLVNVTGRQSDYLYAMDGTRFGGSGMSTLLFSTSGIRRYQFRQTRPDQVTLAVVPNDGVEKEALMRELEVPVARLKEVLKGVTVTLAIVNEIV